MKFSLMAGWRRLVWLGLFLPLAASFAADNLPERPSMPELKLRRGLSGEAAVQALGANLPAVAAHYRKKPDELRAMLRQDRELHLDDRGKLYFVCEGMAAAADGSDTNAAPPVAQIAPLSQTFLLHSKPGASKIIYLDFDGFTISGTAWNNNNGGADIVAPPWDVDGNPGSFSNGEQTTIQQVWYRVAEDYAPFDVDVTTEYPGEAALTRSSSGDTNYGVRALFSAIGDYFGNPGGIAYVGVYDNVGDYYKPALIFPENTGNSEKYMAEACSHEVGHNLGLSHDGTTTGSAYYSGQGNWAPIMGVGYYKPITHWSKGQYANANNTEDDLTVITANGLAYRVDEFGSNIAAATPLAGTSIVTNGIIGRPTDGDYFSFQTGTGTALFTNLVWERGANLHMQVSLYDSGGTLITNVNSVDDSGGTHSVNFSRFLNGGIYYLAVDGVGVGDPLATGYTDYGSLGQYTLSITLPSGGSWLPTPAGSYSWTNTANWAGGNVPGAPDSSAFLTNAISGNQTISLDVPVTIGRLNLGRAGSANGFTIQNGFGGPLTFNVVSGLAGLTKFGNGADEISASVALADSLTVSNGSPAALTFSGPVSGTGGLTKTGAGRLLLAGTNSFTGNLAVSNGTVALTAFATLAAPQIALSAGTVFEAAGGYALAAGQTLAGNGAVAGDVSFATNTVLAPGEIGSAGTITFSNQLALTGGATWKIDLNTNTASGGSTNDLVAINGDLSLAGVNSINVNLLNGALASPGVYTIATYGGALMGSAANLAVTNATRYMLAADTATPGAIQLTVTGSPASLTWRGDGAGNAWNVAGTANWFNGVGADKFYQLDTVLFNDTGSNNVPVSLSGALTPASLTVNAAKNFIFAGSGKISGNAALFKQGAGTLTVSNANDFSGAVIVSGGTLKPANSNALGNASGTTFITNSGVLDLNGINLGAESVVVSGAGAGSGAIINSGAAQQNALRFVTLAGDTTVGGTARWDVRANPTAAFAGNGFRLVKTNASEVWLTDIGETGLGDVEVRQGVLGLAGSTTAGIPANILSLWSGTTLHLWSADTLDFDKALRVTNATIRSDAGNISCAGQTIFSGAVNFPIASSLEMGGSIAGTGSITKSGSGTLILSGSNAYSGTLYVDTGVSSSTSDGAVRIASSLAVQNVASPIQIRNNNSASSTLELDGGINVAQTISFCARSGSVPAIKNVSGSNTLSGGLTLQTGGGNYYLQSDSGSLVLSGLTPVSTPGSLRRLTLQGAGAHLVNGVIQNGTGGGSVALTKTGSGSLTINGTNTYSGSTLLSQGIIYANTASAFGTGVVTNDSGGNNSRILLASGVTVTNPIVVTTANAGTGLGVLMANGNVSATFAGPVSFNAAASSGGHIAGPGSGGPLRFTGPITMPDGLFLSIRTGNVRFSGGGDYGEIQVRASTTSLGADNGIATNAVMDIGGNGSPQSPTYFNLNGFNQTLAGLKNAVTPANVGWVTNSAAITNTLTLSLGTSNYSFGGGIVGRVALTLNSGTQVLTTNGTTLSGLYNYSGNTAINGGTLKLAGGVALPNTPLITVAGGAVLDVSGAPLTVGAGRMLGGGGTVAGRLTMLGTLAPGDGVGTLNCTSNLIFGAGGRVQWELAANATNGADRIVTGTGLTVTNGAAIDLVLNRPGSAVNFLTSFWRTNRLWPVISASAMTGSFSLGTITPDSGGRTAATYGTFTLQTNAAGVNLAWTPIPGFPVIDFPTVVFTSPVTNPVSLPDVASALNLSVAVTGLTNVNVAVTWSQVSGPAAVTFASLSGTNNRVVFPLTGDYVVRCTATNELGSASADLTVRVNPPGDSLVLRQGLNGYSQPATFIREDNTNWNSGARDQILVGCISGKRMRTLLAFDLGVVPPTAAVKSAALDLWTDAQAGAGTVGAFQLHQLTNGFVEGTGDGTSATNGLGTGATWVSRTGGTNAVDLWKQAGGDFDTNAALSTFAGFAATTTNLQRSFASTPVLVAAVGSALASNQPLHLVVWSPATEAAGGSVYARLSSNDSTNEVRRPQLTLLIQPNAAPGVNPGAAPLATNLLAAPLNGTITQATACVWSLVSGPGTATFVNSNQPVTAVVFSQPGNYLLRLTASNSIARTSGDLAVMVNALPPPQLLSSTVSNGQFQFQVAGTPGVNHVIQASTNLVSWQDLFITNPPVMPFLWLDNSPQSLAQRFYRVLIAP